MNKNEKLISKAIADMFPAMDKHRNEELSVSIVDSVVQLSKINKLKNSDAACSKAADFIYSGVTPGAVGLSQISVDHVLLNGVEEEEE